MVVLIVHFKVVGLFQALHTIVSHLLTQHFPDIIHYLIPEVPGLKLHRYLHWDGVGYLTRRGYLCRLYRPHRLLGHHQVQAATWPVQTHESSSGFGGAEYPLRPLLAPRVQFERTVRMHHYTDRQLKREKRLAFPYHRTVENPALGTIRLARIR